MEMDKTPQLDDNDYTFLDNILDSYVPSEIPTLDIEIFRNVYLPLFVQATTAPLMDSIKWRWESEVSKNPRSPVIIVENGNHRYLVPPLVGTISTRSTANEESMDSRYKFLASVSNRMLAQGKIIKEQLFENINPVSQSNEYWQQQWYLILHDFGYVKSDNGEILPASSQVNKSDQEVDYGDEDYQYD